MSYEGLVDNFAHGRHSLVAYSAYAEGPRVGDEYGHWSVITAINRRGVWLMEPYINRARPNRRARGFIPREEFKARF